MTGYEHDYQEKTQKMNQIPSASQGVPQSGIAKIAHELANSISNICGTVQLIEMDLKRPPAASQRQQVSSQLLTVLKHECSRLEDELEALRQLASKSQA